MEPALATLAPGGRQASAAAAAARLQPGASAAATAASLAAAAQGYLHCGPSGAGHFVKMVHNGIEYGLMAAYAEGLNLLAHADAGSRSTGSADAETAPLLCAGVTTFNALRHSGALPGDLVAVQGVGGLGHLGIQFAKKFGYRVAAVGRGSENTEIAKRLGADVYIDSTATNAATELQKLGGASVVLATAPSGKAMSSLVGGLAPNGTLLVIGLSADAIELSPAQLILGKRTIKGWPGGTPTDSEDTLRFAEAAGVRPMIEKYPLEKAAEAYARMMSGEAQYRVVLTMQ